MNEANPQGYERSKLLEEKGAYTFTLRVVEIKSTSQESIGEPEVDWWSTKASFAKHSIYYVSDEQSEFSVKANYELNSNVEKASVFSIDPQLKTLNDGSGVDIPSASGEHTDIHIGSLPDDAPAGVYTFIFTGADGFAAGNRNHKSKRLQPVNQRTGTGTRFNIWYDGATWSSLTSQGYSFGASKGRGIDNSFKRAGITPVWRGTTAGAAATANDGGWSVTYNHLSAAQRYATTGQNVIIAEYQGSSQGRNVDGVLARLILRYNNQPADHPSVAALSIQSLENNYGQNAVIPPQTDTPPDGGGYPSTQLPVEQMNWLLHNSLLHELTHSLAYPGYNYHCGSYYREIDMGYRRSDVVTATCVLRGAPSTSWTGSLINSNVLVRVLPNGATETRRLPWHSMWEVNTMRRQLGLAPWTGQGMYDIP